MGLFITKKTEDKHKVESGLEQTVRMLEATQRHMAERLSEILNTLFQIEKQYKELNYTLPVAGGIIKEYVEQMKQKQSAVNNTAPARKAIRLKDAKERLEGFQNLGLEDLIKRGAEGYREGKKAYIYEDSIDKIKPLKRRRVKGRVTLAGAAYRCGRTYQEVKKKCQETGIPLIKGKRNVLWLTEQDAATLLLKFKI